MKKDDVRKLAPKDWEPYFRKANVRVKDLDACKSNKAKTIKIGRFLSPNLNREVPIEVKGRTGKAVLRIEEGRAKERLYFFDVSWDDEIGDMTTGPQKPKTKKRVNKAAPKQAKVKAKKAKGTTPAAARKIETMGKSKSAGHQACGNDEAW